MRRLLPLLFAVLVLAVPAAADAAVLTYSTNVRQVSALMTTTSLSTAPQAAIYSVGPVDLLAGDVVMVAGSVSFTRPMPGDSGSPPPWTWYFWSQPPPWEGGFAEDHNPAAVSHSIIRADSGPTDTVPEGARPAQAGTDNILQYQHHLYVDRHGFDFITQDLPDRYYNLVAWAAHTKPNAPAGTGIKVDSNGQLKVVVLRP